MVELALVIPLLLFVLFGIIDFGLAISDANTATNLANIGVRAAAVVGTGTSNVPSCGGTTQSTLQAYVQCQANGAGIGSVTACVGDFAGSGAPSSTYTAGDPIKVEVSFTFNWLQILQGIGSLPSTITQNATMRLETGANGQSWMSPTCTS